MPRIYVTYRDGDSTRQEFSDVAQALRSAYGANNVTLSKAENTDFLALSETVKRHDVLIVIIGKRFANIIDEYGESILSDHDDYLHVELRAALEKRNIFVMCVLADKATMPAKSTIPVELATLLDCPSFALNSKAELDKLIQFSRKERSQYQKRIRTSVKQPTGNMTSGATIFVAIVLIMGALSCVSILSTSRNNGTANTSSTQEPANVSREEQATERPVNDNSVDDTIATAYALATSLQEMINPTQRPQQPTRTPYPISSATPVLRDMGESTIFDRELLANASVENGAALFEIYCGECHTQTDNGFDNMDIDPRMSDRVIYLYSSTLHNPDIEVVLTEVERASATGEYVVTLDELHDILAYLLVSH